VPLDAGGGLSQGWHAWTAATCTFEPCVVSPLDANHGALPPDLDCHATMTLGMATCRRAQGGLQQAAVQANGNVKVNDLLVSLHGWSPLRFLSEAGAVEVFVM